MKPASLKVRISLNMTKHFITAGYLFHWRTDCILRIIRWRRNYTKPGTLNLALRNQADFTLVFLMEDLSLSLQRYLFFFKCSRIECCLQGSRALVVQELYSRRRDHRRQERLPSTYFFLNHPYLSHAANRISKEGWQTDL